MVRCPRQRRQNEACAASQGRSIHHARNGVRHLPPLVTERSGHRTFPSQSMPSHCPCASPGFVFVLVRCLPQPPASDSPAGTPRALWAWWRFCPLAISATRMPTRSAGILGLGITRPALIRAGLWLRVTQHRPVGKAVERGSANRRRLHLGPALFAGADDPNSGSGRHPGDDRTGNRA